MNIIKWSNKLRVDAMNINKLRIFHEVLCHREHYTSRWSGSNVSQPGRQLKMLANFEMKIGYKLFVRNTQAHSTDEALYLHGRSLWFTARRQSFT